MILVALASAAQADPPGGVTLGGGTSWTVVGDTPALIVPTAPDEQVVVTIDVRLGTARMSWAVGPVLATSASTVVPIEFPADAFLGDAAATYVSDVTAYVEVGDRVGHASPRVLAWPDGSAGRAVLWSAEEMALFAPQGVLDAALREGDLLPGDRVMPPVTAVPRLTPRVAAPALEVEP